MYKRLTVAQLQQLCTERGIDSDGLRYKREYILALEQCDNDNVSDGDNQYIGAAEGNEAESDSGNDYESDGGKQAVPVEGNERRMTERVMISLLFYEEMRKVTETEERLAQERTQRDAQGPTDSGRPRVFLVLNPHFILHTFLHPVIFSQHMTVPAQPLLQYQC